MNKVKTLTEKQIKTLIDEIIKDFNNDYSDDPEDIELNQGGYSKDDLSIKLTKKDYNQIIKMVFNKFSMTRELVYSLLSDYFRENRDQYIK